MINECMFLFSLKPTVLGGGGKTVRMNVSIHYCIVNKSYSLSFYGVFMDINLTFFHFLFPEMFEC